MEEKQKFKVYHRSQVVQVKFEPQTGCEIKGLHYAIVVTKNDSPFIGTVTVIPLTSQKKSYNLPLGSFIGSGIVKTLREEHDYYRNLVEKTSQKIAELSSRGLLNAPSGKEIKELEAAVDEFEQKRIYFDDLFEKYSQIKEASYAKVQQITTVDKSKILNPLNPLDPIRRLKVPDNVMDRLDEEIVKQFVGKKTKN